MTDGERDLTEVLENYVIDIISNIWVNGEEDPTVKSLALECLFV